MVSDCNCLGCENIAKHQRLRKPFKGPCVPTKSYNFDSGSENYEDQFNENCIPKPIVNENYERNVKTSLLYRTKNIPERFDQPCLLNGYGNQWKKFDPEFHTTNSEYGWHNPNPHTVPHRYHPRSNDFTDLLAKSGMYRNYSLNTVMDKSRV